MERMKKWLCRKLLTVRFACCSHAWQACVAGSQGQERSTEGRGMKLRDPSGQDDRGRGGRRDRSEAVG